MKNRKMLSVVVAAFMVVVMAGTAFAFGTGTLTLTGTAGIDARLDVVIDEVAPGIFETPGYVVIAEDGKSVTFNLAQVVRPDYFGSQYDFVLFNQGNLPAYVSWEIEFENYSANWEEFITIIPELLSPGNQVIESQSREIAVNTSAGFRVIIDYDFDTDETMVTEYVTFTITIKYEWAQ